MGSNPLIEVGEMVLGYHFRPMTPAEQGEYIGAMPGTYIARSMIGGTLLLSPDGTLTEVLGNAENIWAVVSRLEVA